MAVRPALAGAWFAGMIAISGPANCGLMAQGIAEIGFPSRAVLHTLCGNGRVAGQAQSPAYKGRASHRGGMP